MARTDARDPGAAAVETGQAGRSAIRLRTSG
jgi:hypothetical protein